MDGTWEFANLRRQANYLGTFVAACTDDPKRAREARRLAEQAFEPDPKSFYNLRQIVRQLAEWAKELADHPHRPPNPRPDMEDRQTRDYVKDLLQENSSANKRNELSGLQLSLDVAYDALRRMRTLDATTREDASYLYGRATMAIDLGQLTAAGRELLRLKELKKAHADKPA
jgi:hypothetical protein